MGILDKTDKNRLLAIDALRKFVEKNEEKYVEKIKEWKSFIPEESEMADPEMLAGSVTNYLMMYDEYLCNLMWSIWKDDNLIIIEFYVIIGKYFVDCESET